MNFNDSDCSQGAHTTCINQGDCLDNTAPGFESTSGGAPPILDCECTNAVHTSCDMFGEDDKALRISTAQLTFDNQFTSPQSGRVVVDFQFHVLAEAGGGIKILGFRDEAKANMTAGIMIVGGTSEVRIQCEDDIADSTGIDLATGTDYWIRGDFHFAGGGETNTISVSTVSAGGSDVGSETCTNTTAATADGIHLLIGGQDYLYDDLIARDGLP